jgi:hypothetical protein
MSQPFINCSVCSHPMTHILNFDINLCYTCHINSKKQMSDEEFFNLHPQPKELCRTICINPSEIDHQNNLDELNIPEIKRSSAIDNCKDDPLILKKNDDLYVSCGLNSLEIKSSITFDVVPNYRFNEITQQIEKIDSTIEEEDRRLIVLQRNPHAILKEDI